MTTAYAIDVQEHDDVYLAAEERAAECVKKTILPGAYLVDSLPFRAFPLTELLIKQLLYLTESSKIPARMVSRGPVQTRCQGVAEVHGVCARRTI